MIKTFDDAMKAWQSRRGPERADLITSWRWMFERGWEVAANDKFETEIMPLMALMHSELSEALEALRHGNRNDDHVPEYTGLEAELSDVILRILEKKRGGRR